jgi:hypothetical protein
MSERVRSEHVPFLCGQKCLMIAINCTAHMPKVYMLLCTSFVHDPHGMT